MKSTKKSQVTPTDPEVFVIMQSTRCSHCDFDSSENATVTLETIKRHTDGWKAGGHATCPKCGAAAIAINKEIPVLASTFKCPSCDHSDTLKYAIQKIEQTDKSKPGEFDFEVEIKCSKCPKKFSFKKIIKAILDVISIGVGPEGVKVSKAG